MSFWEKWKGVCIPVYFSITAIAILPVSPKNAVKYSVKSVLWGIESALVYFDQFVSEKDKQVKKLKKYSTFNFKNHQSREFVKMHFSLKYHYLTEREFGVVEKALEYKRDGFNEGIKDAYVFVLKTFLFILKINFVAMIRYD